MGKRSGVMGRVLAFVVVVGITEARLDAWWSQPVGETSGQDVVDFFFTFALSS